MALIINRGLFLSDRDKNLIFYIFSVSIIMMLLEVGTGTVSYTHLTCYIVKFYLWREQLYILYWIRVLGIIHGMAKHALFRLMLFYPDCDIIAEKNPQLYLGTN